MTHKHQLDLSDTALRAMKKAVRNVLQQRKKTGETVYVLKSGRLVKFKPASKKKVGI